MPIMEAGLFGLLAGGGFILLVISFKFGALLKVISAVLFFSVALVLMAGYEVAYTTETTGTPSCPPNDPCITQHFLIREDDTTGDTSGTWAAWLFVLLGIFSSLLFIMEMFVFN